MKTLKDSILEKLSIDDINLNGDFPIDGKLDDMIEFLERDHFKKVLSYGNWNQTFEKYEKYNTKCFTFDKAAPVTIEIINRANPKFKNKLFYIKLNSDDKYNIFDDITTARSGWDCRAVSKEDFLKELSEIL